MWLGINKHCAPPAGAHLLVVVVKWCNGGKQVEASQLVTKGSTGGLEGPGTKQIQLFFYLVNMQRKNLYPLNLQFLADNNGEISYP